MSNGKAFGNLIYSYTRAQAIADGVLIDVTDAAKAHGFKIGRVHAGGVNSGVVQAGGSLQPGRDGRGGHQVNWL